MKYEQTYRIVYMENNTKQERIVTGKELNSMETLPECIVSFASV